MIQLEVAGTIIQLEDDDAALVVYTSKQWQGAIVKAYYDKYYDGVSATATVVARTTPQCILYAAVFARINMKEHEWKNPPLKRKNFWVEAKLYRYKGGHKEEIGSNYEASVTLFAGNVIELDWTWLS